MNEEKIKSIHEVVDELYKWKSREDVLKEKLKIVRSQVLYYRAILKEIRKGFRTRAFLRLLRKLFQ